MQVAVINRVEAGPLPDGEFNSHGKTIYVTGWKADVTLADGKMIDGVKLRAFSSSPGTDTKVNWLVVDGSKFVADKVEERDGITEVKIATPGDGTDAASGIVGANKQGEWDALAGSSGSAPASGGGFFKGEPAKAQPTQQAQPAAQCVDSGALGQLCGNCLTNAVALVAAEIVAGKADNASGPDVMFRLNEVFVAMIAMSKREQGIDIKQEPAKPAKSESGMNDAMRDALVVQIYGHVAKAGLTEALGLQADWTDDVLVKCWTKYKGEVEAFIGALRSALGVCEPEEEDADRLPF